MIEETKMMSKELKVIARLVFENNEVARIEKTFCINEPDELTEDIDISLITKTLDDTVTEFLNEVQSISNQNNYVVSKQSFTNAIISMILFIIKESEQEIVIDIDLEKSSEEEKEDGDCKENYS